MTETIVYHGSPNLFDRFDYRKIRTNGTSEGVGFYFTNAKHIAEGYGNNGYVYTARFTGKKPLSHDSLSIDREAFKRFLSALDEKTGYLSNWGETAYQGYDNVLEIALDGEMDTSDNDVDLISGVVNSSGDAETTLTLCEQLLGYDCIITPAEWGGGQIVYIALTQNAFEIIDVENKLKENGAERT